MRIHVAGGWLHPSHLLNYHSQVRVRFCGSCGATADQRVCSLGKPCSIHPTCTGRACLRRLAEGLPPKTQGKAGPPRQRPGNQL
eukprot:3596875-Pyramimonas_sp.AAC.1